MGDKAENIDIEIRSKLTGDGFAKGEKALGDLGQTASTTSAEVGKVGTSATAAGAAVKDHLASAIGHAAGLSENAASQLSMLSARMLGVAGVALVVGKAWHDGSEEIKAMTLAIERGGAISGQSAESLRAQAAEMAATSQLTMSQAKEITQVLAASGQIGAGAFHRITETAGNFARVMGVEVAKVGPELVKLFSDPAKGAEELNKQMHFLTAVELDHIEHLTRMGDVTAAQVELAGKLNARLGEITPNLGLVERAWFGVTGAASKAWDAMMGVGRQESTKARLDAVYARIKDVQALGAGARNLPAAQQVPALMQQALKLEDQLEREAQSGFDKAQAAEKNRNEQEERAIAKRYSTAVKAAAIDAQILRMKKSSVAGAAEAVTALEQERADLFKKPKVAKTPLQRMLDVGQKNELDAYYETGGEETMREVGEKRAMASAREAIQQAQAAARAQEAMRVTVSGLTTGYSREGVKAADALKIMPQAERELAESLRQVQDRAQAAREALSHKAASINGNEQALEAFREAMIQVADAEEKQKQAVIALASEQDRLNQSWDYGASKAMRSYLDGIQNVAKQSERFMDGMLRNAEDAFVNIGKTGRFEIGNLGAFIRDEMMRSLYRQNFAPAVASATSWISSAVGSLFGGFKAEGGPLEQGKWYIAGEYGPEPVWGGGPGAFATGYGSGAGGGGGGGTSVQVFDQRSAASSAPVTMEQGSGSDGMQQIRFFIRDEVRSQISSGGLDKPMRDTYGVSRRITARG